ncbi:uncharacterized protein LOC131651709 [Vicia villosa]|uniref:uncharacterized protein LOC131651709 n=1 Tax=Vicia villosa TaxID=3911 RepID=UPI00273B2A52|nr:uncharacterized protein LOC131651709 [Vicia villosa]
MEVLSAGAVLCEGCLSDSNIVHCNLRFNQLESKVGEKLWAAMAKYGVVNQGGVRDYKEKIDEMEKRDRENKGGGNFLKRKKVNSIISQGKADIFFIQESKLEVVDCATVSCFWRKVDVGWSFSKSSGASGGLIMLWKEGSFDVIHSFAGAGYLSIKLRWKGKNYYIVNVYSPCELNLKRKLWRELLSLKAKFSYGEWIMGGDFNSNKNERERKGCVVSRRSEMRYFSSLIEESNLVDLQCKGKRYSWYGGAGRAMSRIDIFLVDEAIISRWGIVRQLIGERDISDHCPAWIIINKEDWGPKPFMVNNSWFENKDFIPYVEQVWRNIKVEGRRDFVLKEKFRILKGSLRSWITEVFGKFDLEIEA